jgi:hypothetical protein
VSLRKRLSSRVSTIPATSGASGQRSCFESTTQHREMCTPDGPEHANIHIAVCTCRSVLLRVATPVGGKL